MMPLLANDTVHSLARPRVAGVFLALLALAPAACSPGGISAQREAELLKEVRTRGYIAGFEGLQPFSGYSAMEIVRAAAEDNGLSWAATSGNYLGHWNIIQEAARNGQPIYLLGYSMGGEEARALAVKCEEHKIPVRILFLLDPRYMAGIVPGKVPANVNYAVFYTSATYDSAIGVTPSAKHLADPEKTTLHVEDCRAVGHMGLPSFVASRVRGEVSSDAPPPGRPLPESRPDTQPDADDTAPATQPESMPATQPDWPVDTAPLQEPATRPAPEPETAPATQPATQPASQPETKPAKP